MKTTAYLLILGLVIRGSVAPPTGKDKIPEKEEKKEEHTEEENTEERLRSLGYERYLRQVVEALESDPEFKNKLEKAEEPDFRNGRVAAELEFVNHNVRTKLDELKRIELIRLRDLIQKAHEADPHNIDPTLMQPPEHLDHSNPHSFEVADLHKLITKVANDLSEADRKRREEFKEYELQKKYEEQQKLNSIQDEKEKEDFVKQMEEIKKKHSKHEPLHHPGSKAQLEQVWEEEDHMTQDFDPKTFFRYHDLDGNGYWDEVETKTLFKHELDKMYQAGAPEDDMKERAEEMERMREHVFKETDLNGDKLISYKEFLEHTKKQEFKRDEGWETLDQQEIYTPEEYKAFEDRRQKEIQKLIEKGVVPPHPQYGGGYPNPNHHPGMAQYPQMGQPQMGHPQMGQPQMGQPQMGHPQMGQPQMGHPQMGQPQMGQPQMGHPQMGQYPQVGQHPQAMAQHPNQQNIHQAQQMNYQQGQMGVQPPSPVGVGQGGNNQRSPNQPQSQQAAQMQVPMGHPQGQVPMNHQLPQGQVPMVQQLPQGRVPMVQQPPQGHVPVGQNPPQAQLPINQHHNPNVQQQYQKSPDQPYQHPNEVPNAPHSNIDVNVPSVINHPKQPMS